MLSENQVKRLLKHCENMEADGGEVFPGLDADGWMYWCQALRLVLEEDTYPIRKDPIDV